MSIWDVAPACTEISQPYGCVDYAGEWACSSCGTGRFHAGIDLSGPSASIFRSPVYATRSGVINAVGIQYLGDQAVAVRTDEGLTLEHGHLDEARVNVGQRVKVGDLLGLLGTKGQSTGPHLHLEVRVDGPFQGVAGCPDNDPTRNPVPYLRASRMIIGLDSSGFRPAPATALQARAAGIRLWSGYLATKGSREVGITGWDQASFEAARLCGGIPIGFCSGWDDAGAVRQLAMAWNVRPCLDVEDGIRGNGPWVQPWLDASGAGLYGNAGVHAGRQAPFYIFAAYPGSDPGKVWPDNLARPDQPVGWQWQGTHDEFGGGVDRGWYEDWFLLGGEDMTPEQDARLTRLEALLNDVHGGMGALVSIEPSRPRPLAFETRDMVKELSGKAALSSQADAIQKALGTLQTPSVDVEALSRAIVAKLPAAGQIDTKALAQAVVDEIGVRVKPPL